MSLQAGLLDYDSWWDQSGLRHYAKNANLDRAIELASLHGMYTGIVSVALWNIFISKSRSIGVAIIILLYITTSINFFFNGPFLVASTLNPDMNFYRGNEPFAVMALYPSWGWSPSTDIGIGAAAVMSTVVADCTMIWRCWMVWGRRWLVVLFPILCLVTGFALKTLEIMSAYLTEIESVSYLVSYLTCILVTTLWCTILIVFRIVTVIRANNGANTRLGDYRHVIEVLVESSALHSATLIIYVFLEANNYVVSSSYLDALAVFTTGIAPTLLVGRVAAGHARPDDSWQGSILSSLRFEAHPKADDETYSHATSMVDNDLEVQSNEVDETEEIGAEKRV